MFNLGLTQAQLLGLVQQPLQQLKTALEAVSDLGAWSAAISAADLETTYGFSAADAAALQSAIADAAALARFYDTGLPPASYPQPSSAYIYGASQRQVIGPR